MMRVTVIVLLEDHWLRRLYFQGRERTHSPQAGIGGIVRLLYRYTGSGFLGTDTDTDHVAIVVSLSWLFRFFMLLNIHRHGDHDHLILVIRRTKSSLVFVVVRPFPSGDGFDE